MNYFVTVLTHNSAPYTSFDSFRKEYFVNKNVPHTFVHNSSRIFDLYKVFIETLQTNTTLSNYDYIVRVNSSTFLNIPALESIINTLPIENCYAGYFGGIINNVRLPVTPNDFISGTCIIFSKDIIKKLINLPVQNSNKEDDLIYFDIMRQLNIPRTFIPMYWYDNNILPSIDELKERIQKFPLIRIKNQNREAIDIPIWNNLLNLTMY